ncbi:MAG: carboxypeptidase regulatory-like domain-containing protein, partial [Acidobacteriota bacterium]
MLEGLVFGRRGWLVALAWALAVQGAVDRGLADPSIDLDPGGPGVAGTVRYGDGWPAAGARVELAPVLTRAQASALLTAGRLGPEPVSAVEVNDGGDFRLRAPGPGVYRVRVTAVDHLAMERGPLVLTTPGPDRRPRVLPPLILRRAATVGVRALDGSGKPLGAGWVWGATADPGRWADGWLPARRLLAVGEGGAVSVPRAPGEVLSYTLVGRTGRGTAMESRPGVVDSKVQLRLPAAAEQRRRTVRVADADGRPSAAVWVHGGSAAWPIGVTGADGALSLAVPRGRALPLLLAAEGGREARALLEVPAEGTDDAGPMQIRLPRSRSVAVRVTDSGDGPLAGAVVWSGGDPGIWAVTDGRGRASLELPGGDGSTFQVEAEGYAPGRFAAPSDGTLDVALHRDVVLQRTVTLSGKVVDPDERPLDGAHLAAFPSSDPSAAGRGPGEDVDVEPFRFDPADGRAQSGPKGQLVLGDLVPGRAYRIAVTRAGFAPARIDLRAPSAPRSGLEVVLRPDRVVYGRVVDLDDRPVEGAVVVLGRAGGPRPVQAPEPAPEGRGRFRAVTDGEGRFSGLRAPAAVVDASVFGAGFVPNHVRGLEIPAVPEADLGTLVMRPGVGLGGRVYGADGEGLGGVRVHLLRTEEALDHLMGDGAERVARRRPEAETAEDGSFRIGELRPGERLHALFLGAGHRAAWVRHLEVPTADLTVRLESAVAVGGRVVDGAGEGIAGASVVLSWREPVAEGLPPSTARVDEREAWTEEDGTFRFDDAAPGPATLEVWATGWVRPEPLDLVLEEGVAEDDLRIQLDAGAVLEGRVQTASGDGLDGALVRSGAARGRSDADGLYRIDGVPLGDGAVEVLHPLHGRQDAELEIEAGVNVHDVTFPDGLWIRGVVVDGVGEPVPGAWIQLRGASMENPRHQDLRTDGAGAFELGPLAEGRYVVELDKPGYSGRPRTTEVDLEGAAVEDLRLTMVAGAVVRGRILGLDEDRLAEVSVEADAPGERSRHGRVDYRGSFEIRDLAPGPWRLRASLPGGGRQARARLTLPPGLGEAEVDLVFDRGLRLDGRVLEDGEPVPGASVTLRGLGLAVDRTVTTDRDGAFQLQDLSAGRYAVEMVHARRHLVHNQALELVSDRQLDIDLRPARVSGRVRVAG